MSLPIDPTLLPFFEPQGIVLVGASRNPMKLGFGLARNLVQSGYAGAIHFVNPGGGTLLERPSSRPCQAGRCEHEHLSQYISSRKFGQKRACLNLNVTTHVLRPHLSSEGLFS